MSEMLEELRKRIQEIDTEIVRLLRRRMHIVRQVGAVKKSDGLSLVDPAREQEVLNHVSKQPHEPISTAHLLDLYRRIIAISRETQSSVFSEKME